MTRASSVSTGVSVKSQQKTVAFVYILVNISCDLKRNTVSGNEETVPLILLLDPLYLLEYNLKGFSEHPFVQPISAGIRFWELDRTGTIVAAQPTKGRRTKHKGLVI